MQISEKFIKNKHGRKMTNAIAKIRFVYLKIL